MCSFKLSKMLVANEGITCFKIIEVHHLKDGTVRYQSYYQETEIKLGSPIEAADKLAVKELNKLKILNGEVTHAYISNPCSFLSQSDVEELKKLTAECFNDECESIDIAVIECTIPNGVIYCKCRDKNRNTPTYGAVTIVPNRIIKILATIHQ